MSDRKRMKPRVTIRRALSDKHLLGKALAGPTWRYWRILLTAVMGEKLTADELKIFTELTGRTVSPTEMVKEAAFVIGRRGGKSRALAVLAVYLACLCDHPLDAGEGAVALIVAMDKDQAGVCLAYALAAIEQSAALGPKIKSKTSDAITLTNGITIEVRSPSFRRLRGRTAIAVLCDELAFWYSNETSANPDVEIINAVKPMLATTGGPLLLASSPYSRKGVLYDVFRSDYGDHGDPKVLVAKATSQQVNPSLPDDVVQRALEKDPAMARAEYLAEFRTDIESFVDIDRIRACIGEKGVYERGPILGFSYRVFVDVAGGSGSDSMTMSIVHRQGEKTVVDLMKEIKPPFSPAAATAEFCEVLKRYHVTSVIGDRYAGDYAAERFREHGVTYKVSEKSKSQLYTAFLPMLNEGTVVLLDHPRTIQQLAGLERRTSFGGVSDKIDHGPGGHDDLANVVAGACCTVGMGRGAQPGARDHNPPKVLIGYEAAKRMTGNKAGRGITPNRTRRDEISIKHQVMAADVVQSEREPVGSHGHTIQHTSTGADGRKKYFVFNPAGMEAASAWGREQAVDFVAQLIQKGTITR